MAVDIYIKKTKKNKNSPYKDKPCFKCGKQGHIELHCKSNRRKRKF